MINIDYTQTNIGIKPELYKSIFLFIMKEQIKKVSNLDDKSYLNVIMPLEVTNYGINDREMDINTSEVEEIWRHFTSMVKNDDILISQSVDAFRVYSKISEIYYSNKKDLVEFLILLDNEEYDFELMHELFTVEQYLYKIWDGKYLDFHYIPITGINKSTLFDYHIVYKKG